MKVEAAKEGGAITLNSPIAKFLSEEEKAALSNSIFLDTNNEEVEVDTGIYGVEMGVMEECLDALKVTTKVVTVRGKKSCKVLSVESYGQRDCG
jgi:hypothetical protein